MGEASEAMRRLLFSDTAGGNKNKKMAHKINVARQYFSRVASLTGRFALFLSWRSIFAYAKNKRRISYIILLSALNIIFGPDFLLPFLLGQK